MAILKNGALGTDSGKIENLLEYPLKSKQVYRSMPRKSIKPPTFVQEEDLMRFRLVMHFLSPLKSLINKGYGNSKGTKSQFSQCVDYHIKNGVTGVYPALEIDYSKVVLTRGWLQGAANAKVFSNHAGYVDFSWTNDLESRWYRSTDEAILLAYHPPAQGNEFFLKMGLTRAAECSVIEVSTEFSGHSVHCWIAFISADGKEFSTSRYLGKVTVA